MITFDVTEMILIILKRFYTEIIFDKLFQNGTILFIFIPLQLQLLKMSFRKKQKLQNF